MDIIKELRKPLNISDIDFRVQSINKGGYATILAYKDARVDMNRLDDVCGVKWQKDYKTINNNLFCGIGIEIDNQWVWRWDVGVESYTEKTKGEASDSFKRAGFCWGIGRELYDYPRIQVKLKKEEFTIDNGRAKQTYNLKIRDWTWGSDITGDGEILNLACKDDLGELRFHYKIKKD